MRKILLSVLALGAMTSVALAQPATPTNSLPTVSTKTIVANDGDRCFINGHEGVIMLGVCVQL